MDKKYTWQVEDIYESVDKWNADYTWVQNNCDFSEFKGKLNTANGFLDCMKREEKVLRVFDKLSVYAMMRQNENAKVALYNSLLSKVTSLGAKLGANTSFMSPELTALPVETIKSYIDNPKLKEYDYTLKCVLKEKEHVLSESEEKLLAESSEALSSFSDIFEMIDNADLPLKKIRYNGKTFPLTHGTYGVYMQSQDRSFREKVFKSYYKSYISLINVITQTYYGNVKKDVFNARARKYDSVLQCALLNEDVSTVVYKNLIDSVNENLPLLHEYLAEKKKALGYEKMHMYDVYVPTVKNADIKLEYEEAYELVIKGLAPLGKDYQDLLRKAKDERWIDVYESEGKRSGAYSVCVFDTHPFVLLNYQKTTHEIFTIAHEMGHSIHSYFSNKSQPYAKADYKIFVAEVASTVNEVLLVKYLLSTEKDLSVKKYLLSYLMEMIRTTLFRQTQFAEFEEFSHSSVENGTPLTNENLCEKYLELNKKYYGSDVISDKEISYEWARIPHFYRAFYVYKYATGIISALKIADRILTEGKSAVEDYFKFLSSGSSDGPVELLKIAGVDLTNKETFRSAFSQFENALKEFKSL